MGAPEEWEWTSQEAVCERMPLLVALSGPTATGKTYSALRLATGIQRVQGGDIWMIDTEARRGLHYAKWFKYRYVPFEKPYPSAKYTSAVHYCISQGARIIIIDSMSHEHESVGGMLEQHESERTRLAREWKTSEKATDMPAWGKPKRARAEMLFELTHLPLDVSLIFCFRAKDKIKIPPKGSASKDPIDCGYSAITAPELIFEMTVAGLLLPGSKKGVPTFQSNLPGELDAIKLPRQFEGVVDTGEQLSEDIGEKMARWATTGDVNGKPTPMVGAPKLTAELLEALRGVSSRADLEAVRVRLSEGRTARVFSSTEMRDLAAAVKACEAAHPAPVEPPAEDEAPEPGSDG